MTRRELLSLLLGAPLAAEACRRSRPQVAGSLRGASLEIGHRLRDATIEQAGGPERRVGIAIVGAGPSGLSAAWRLTRQDERDFVVFDLEAQPGGTSAWGTDGPVPYPWGAHYVPVPRPENRALVALLDEIGVLEPRDPGEPVAARERHLVRAPEVRVFDGGSWEQGLVPQARMQQGLEEWQRFEQEIARWVGWRDERGRRAFTLPLAQCSDAAEVVSLDRQSAAAWLEARDLRSEVVRWYVEYACRDDYGTTLETTSAWAMLFYFAARVGAPQGPSAPFLTWPEGNGRLIRHLAQVAGERLKLGHLVTDVVPGPNGVVLSVFDVASRRLVRYRADQVILAVPRFVAGRVLRPWRESQPSFLDAFSYGAWAVANLHLRERPASPGFPFAWDNVLYESPSLGYVVATHQTFRDFGPTVWTYYQPLTEDPVLARATLQSLDHATVCEAILADLGRAHRDLEAAIERIDVWRWGHAMVRPTPGFIWGPERRRSGASLGRVHFAHSDLSGLPLFEEAQDQGVRAAEAVLRVRGREVKSLAG